MVRSLILTITVGLIAIAGSARSVFAVCLEDAYAYQKARHRVLQSGINTFQLLLTGHPKPSSQRQADIENKLKVLGDDLDDTDARLGRLARQLLAAHECHGPGVLSAAEERDIGRLTAYSRDLALPAGFPLHSFLGQTWEEFKKNGDQVVWGEAQGVGMSLVKAVEGIGKVLEAGGKGILGTSAEVVNVTVDAQTEILIGIFDPDSGHYYQVRSHLFRGVQYLKEKGVAQTAEDVADAAGKAAHATVEAAKSIPISMYRDAMSGDPERTGEALGNYWMLLLGAEGAAEGASAMGARLGEAAQGLKLTYPGLEYAPALDGTAVLTPVLREVGLAPTFSQVGRLLGGGGSMAMACTAISEGGGGGEAPPKPPEAPGITDQYFSKDLPREFPAEFNDQMANEPKVTQLQRRMNAELDQMSWGDFKKVFQAWIDEMNQDPEKGYLPGMTKDKNFTRVDEFVADVEAHPERIAKYGASEIDFGAYTYFDGTQIKNVWGQMRGFSDAENSTFMLIPKYWEKWRKSCAGRLILERFMREMAKRGHQIPNPS